MENLTAWAFSDDILLRNWRYYIQGLPYTRLVDLLKDAQRIGLNVSPYHRLKKKRKWYLRQEIFGAFYQSEEFQERLHNTLKAYFCKNCGGRREGYAGRYNKTFDACTCEAGRPEMSTPTTKRLMVKQKSERRTKNDNKSFRR